MNGGAISLTLQLPYLSAKVLHISQEEVFSSKGIFGSKSRRPVKGITGISHSLGDTPICQT